MWDCPSCTRNKKRNRPLFRKLESPNQQLLHDYYHIVAIMSPTSKLCKTTATQIISTSHPGWIRLDMFQNKRQFWDFPPHLTEIKPVAGRQSLWWGGTGHIGAGFGRIIIWDLNLMSLTWLNIVFSWSRTAMTSQNAEAASLLCCSEEFGRYWDNGDVGLKKKCGKKKSFDWWISELCSTCLVVQRLVSCNGGNYI